jgi:uncharacterized iron-regulated membrane protein
VSFRKTIFWLHLIAGVVAGIVILVMSVTGVALAFEKEIIAWAERDVRRITPPADAKRLPVDELIAKVREQQPNGRPSTITINSDSSIAVLVGYGRTNGFYVNPYTGAVQPQGASGTRKFMTLMVEWHRFLGRAETQRPIGKAITGACNVAFCFLGLSGIYLWWPRQWSKTALRAIALFKSGLSGKARDWNWHNVIGIWSAPVLVVLTATAMPISYRWATDVIYKVTGTIAPAPGAGPGATPAVQVPAPPEGAKPLQYEVLLSAVQKHAPEWNQITLRMGGGGPRGGASGGSEGQRGGERREGGGERGGDSRISTNRPAPQAIGFAVKARDGSPRFTATQLSLDPFTAEVLSSEGYADYNRGRKVRSWTRFLHTGEALGPVGQFVAGLASLGGAVLVWTGVSLALRRFFGNSQ